MTLWLSQVWECHLNLVVCPKKAIPVWRAEIVKLGLNLSEWTLVTFESFSRNHLDYLKPWSLMVIDESHRIKERSSNQSKRSWKVGKMAAKRLILSGSPQGNGMEDYYSQLKFIRPDLFPSWKQFSDEYLIIEQKWRQGMDDPFPAIVGYKNEEKFQGILASISLRKTRDEVAKVKTLVRIKKLWVDWNPESRDHYMRLDKKLFTDIKGTLASTPIVLTKALKLHQLCGGFLKDDLGEIHQVGTEKLQALWNLLDGELRGSGVVVVAQYKAEMDAIGEGLSQRGITFAQVRGRHQYDPLDRSQVTLLNPSAGEAINLSHHRVMVIFSMNYSYLKWEQFKDRIVLVDTPEVKYYYLMMKNSMDEVVYDTVIEKRSLAERIMSIYNSAEYGKMYSADN